jgi:hypothetical protein
VNPVRDLRVVVASEVHACAREASVCWARACQTLIGTFSAERRTMNSMPKLLAVLGTIVALLASCGSRVRNSSGDTLIVAAQTVTDSFQLHCITKTKDQAGSDIGLTSLNFRSDAGHIFYPQDTPQYEIKLTSPSTVNITYLPTKASTGDIQLPFFEFEFKQGAQSRYFSCAIPRDRVICLGFCPCADDTSSGVDVSRTGPDCETCSRALSCPENLEGCILLSGPPQDNSCRSND